MSTETGRVGDELDTHGDGDGRPAGSSAGGLRAGRGRPPRYSADELLDLVVTVFNERGYEATSMEDLARATGLNKSSFYHHFSGKEQLLSLGVGRALDALAAVLAEPAATEGRP